MKPGALGESLRSSMVARQELGNLVPDDHIAGAEASTVGDKMIPVDLIDPSPYQPRLKIDEDRIEALAENIKEIGGILQPIVVRPKPDDRYELVAGERRWRAFKACGYTQIPANIRHLSDAEAFKMCATENLQREGLAPFEIAKMLKSLKETKVCKSAVDIAKLTGINRVSIPHYLRYFELPADVVKVLESAPDLIGWNYVSPLVEFVREGHEAVVTKAVLRIRDQKLQPSKAEEWIRAAIKPDTVKHERREFANPQGHKMLTLSRGGKRISINVEDESIVDELHAVIESAMHAFIDAKAK
jgi:ParB/RepB/Spo0J family partition protein